MMCVIINDGNAADISLVLETTVCACKAGKAFELPHPEAAEGVLRQWQPMRWKHCGCPVHEGIAADFFALEKNREGRMSVLIPGDVGSGIISDSLILQRVGDNFAWKAFGLRNRIPAYQH